MNSNNTCVENTVIPFTFFFTGTALAAFCKELSNLKKRQYTCTDIELPKIQDKISKLEKSLKFTQTLISN